MTRYDELMAALKKATTTEEMVLLVLFLVQRLQLFENFLPLFIQFCDMEIQALKAYEDAYKYNAKEMELLS